jgi:hypothetical protein
MCSAGLGPGMGGAIGLFLGMEVARAPGGRITILSDLRRLVLADRLEINRRGAEGLRKIWGLLRLGLRLPLNHCNGATPMLEAGLTGRLCVATG